MWILSLALLTSCSSPKASDLLGAEAKQLAQGKVDGAVVMLGALPSGEWVTAIARGEKVERQTLPPTPDRPMPFHAAGVTVVVGQAPAGATQFALLNENRLVIKGKVENGVYLIAWPSANEKPAFILRLLDSDGNELYRWPPPGALPAA